MVWHPIFQKTPDVSQYIRNSCYVANIQNTNPVANYDRIQGKGVIPTQKGGAVRSGTVVQNLPNRDIPDANMVGGGNKSRKQEK